MRHLVFSILALVQSSLLTAAEWPEFRGPNRDGTVDATLPTEWSEEKNITWKKPVHGSGWSTPLISEGKIWLTTATLNGRELAVAAYLSEHLASMLIGRDEDRIEDTWQYLYRGAYWRRGPVTMAAIAASAAVPRGSDFPSVTAIDPIVSVRKTIPLFVPVSRKSGCDEGTA